MKARVYIITNKTSSESSPRKNCRTYTVERDPSKHHSPPPKQHCVRPFFSAKEPPLPSKRRDWGSLFGSVFLEGGPVVPDEVVEHSGGGWSTRVSVYPIVITTNSG